MHTIGYFSLLSFVKTDMPETHVFFNATSPAGTLTPIPTPVPMEIANDEMSARIKTRIVFHQYAEEAERKIPTPTVTPTPFEQSSSTNRNREMFFYDGNSSAFHRYQRPTSLDGKPWTILEEKELIKWHRLLQKNWNLIATHMSYAGFMRKESECQQKWNTLCFAQLDY